MLVQEDIQHPLLPGRQDGNFEHYLPTSSWFEAERCLWKETVIGRLLGKASKITRKNVAKAASQRVPFCERAGHGTETQN